MTGKRAKKGVISGFREAHATKGGKADAIAAAAAQRLPVKETAPMGRGGRRDGDGVNGGKLTANSSLHSAENAWQSAAQEPGSQICSEFGRTLTEFDHLWTDFDQF